METIANISLILGYVFYLLLCLTMAVLLMMVRRVSKDVSEIKKAVEMLDHRIGLIQPGASRAAVEGE